MQNPHAAEAHPSFPATEELLVAGGDARIALDADSGTNKYGCTPFPDPELAAFGSSTASVISTPGFAAADQLRNRLATTTEAPGVVYACELERIRQEFIQLCGLSDLPGLETAFTSSGTDLHCLAGQLAGGTQDKPTLAIMVEERETGSGVATALSSSGNIEIASVPIRFDNGSPRPTMDVDAEVEARVSAAAAQGQRILLIMVDLSKTGLIAPSPACVARLHDRLPKSLDVLVDACQFRITTSTLRVYLDQGFMVGLTGSKFIAGPSFSGVLLIPSTVAPRLRGNLHRHSAEENPGYSDFGLLLHWEAALAELRAFHALPENTVSDFLRAFALAVQHRLSNDPAFELLPTPTLDRHPLTGTTGWDAIQTIFSFLLYRHAPHAGRAPLNREEMAQISRLLQRDLSGDDLFSSGKIAALRCQLGQPVACGMRDGVPVSALRLCVSARLIVEATTKNGAGSAAVIARAMAALDKTVQLAMCATRL